MTETLITTNDYWRTRHEAYAPGWWSQHYWDDWQATPRLALAQAMGQCGAFRSVLEVGCGPGANLRLWRSLWPGVELIGVDLNAEAIVFATEQFAADPLTTVVEADIFACRNLPPVDLVVGCAMLTTIEPGRIWPLFRACWATVQVGMVFCEAVDIGGKPVGRMGGPSPSWRHDYSGLLAELTPLPARWAMASLSTQHETSEGLVMACKVQA